MRAWPKLRANPACGPILWTLGALAPAAFDAAPAIAATPAPAYALLEQPAPDFALPAAVGDNIRLSEYRGQPVVLAFWSSRCGTCAAMLAALARYYATYRSSGLVVLAVSVEDDPRRASTYARAHATSYPLLLDRTKSVSRAYQIERLPTTVLIDRSGLVRYLHSDDRAGDAVYVAQIRALLDDKVDTP